MNEDSRGHIRHYTKGGILFSSPKTSYMEANTQKDEETCIYAMEIILGHPRAYRNYTDAPGIRSSKRKSKQNTQKDEETCIYAMEIILGHPRAYRNYTYAPGMRSSKRKSKHNCFLLLFSGEIPIFKLP
jgi:hypothetical protein